jgi:hypothetical protein
VGVLVLSIVLVLSAEMSLRRPGMPQAVLVPARRARTDFHPR